MEAASLGTDLQGKHLVVDCGKREGTLTGLDHNADKDLEYQGK